MSKYLMKLSIYYELFAERLSLGIELEVTQLNKEIEIHYFIKM